MSDEHSLAVYSLTLSAALARDLEQHGMLSDPSRRAIHNGLASLRDMTNESNGSPPEVREQLTVVLRMLDAIAPPADG